MKKVLSFLCVALCATVMFSCDKENEADPNTLVYDGTEYEMNSYYRYEQGGRVYIDAEAVDKVGENVPLFTIISDNPDNGTYDLPATQDQVFFGCSSESDQIEGFSTEDFASGTVVVLTDDEAFNFKVNGTLNSGVEVSFYIYVPVDEWIALEY